MSKMTSKKTTFLTKIMAKNRFFIMKNRQNRAKKRVLKKFDHCVFEKKNLDFQNYKKKFTKKGVLKNFLKKFSFYTLVLFWGRKSLKTHLFALKSSRNGVRAILKFLKLNLWL